MRTFLIVAVAVAVSGAAFAKDLKSSVMTDSEMDKVIAGAGLGLNTAGPASNGNGGNGFTNGVNGNPATGRIPVGTHTPGFGNCTAGRPGAPCG